MQSPSPFKISFDGANFHFGHTAEPAEENDYYRHNHTWYELYVFFDGDVNFIVEDRVFHMEPNTLLLIPPRTYHYAAVKRSERLYNRLVLSFDYTFVSPELHPFLKTDINPAMLEERHAARLRDLENSLSRYKKKDAALAIGLFLNGLLIDLKYAHVAAAGAEMLSPTITRILDYINEHIHEPLSMKRIAENTFLNQSYLSQLFSAQMKIGLMDYIKQKKIYLAEELMREEGLPPTEASARMGFCSYSTFYRLHKKYLSGIPSDSKK